MGFFFWKKGNFILESSKPLKNTLGTVNTSQHRSSPRWRHGCTLRWCICPLTHLNLCSPLVLYFSGISESAGAKQTDFLILLDLLLWKNRAGSNQIKNQTEKNESKIVSAIFSTLLICSNNTSSLVFMITLKLGAQWGKSGKNPQRGH